MAPRTVAPFLNAFGSKGRGPVAARPNAYSRKKSRIDFFCGLAFFFLAACRDAGVATIAVGQAEYGRFTIKFGGLVECLLHHF